ncbi:Heptaprenyl diphosphate synthase component 1 [compost metagenome]
MIPDHITKLAKKYVEYDMISAHTELPEFPAPRVGLLYTFLNGREDVSARSAEICSLAAFLVQLGMDTHDRIDTAKGRKDEMSMRSRQLKVLAGDYFSSVFYELLAKIDEIDTVSAMSTAICEVNRLKVRLYTKLQQIIPSAEDYIKDSVQVKMGLFLSFSQFMDKSVRNLWKLLLTELSRCEVMLDEMKYSGESPLQRKGYAYLRIMESGTSEDKSILSQSSIDEPNWHALLAKYNVKEQLTAMLNQSVERVHTLVQECSVEQQRADIREILKQIHATLLPGRHSFQ